MEQRSANTWRMTVNEKKFIETALLSDRRVDFRTPFEYRRFTVKFGRVDGSSEVQLGQTHVMGFVTSQLVQPYRDRPNEGTLSIYTEFSPMADPSFEAGRPGEFAVELGRIIDRGLRESRAVDTESLCVLAGKLVWSIRIDLHILDNGGNLVDAANIAALAALMTFRRPECTFGGEDGQDVIVHPPEVYMVFLDETKHGVNIAKTNCSKGTMEPVEKEPLPLIIHHLPIAITFAFFGDGNIVVMDPTHHEEAVMGGRMTATLNTNGDVCSIQKVGEGINQSMIMRCLRQALLKAADVTTTIKNAVEAHNTERALRKIKRHSSVAAVDVSGPYITMKDHKDQPLIQRGVGDFSGHRVEKVMDKPEESCSLDNNGTRGKTQGSENITPFIGGPSSWGPYSKGVDSNSLKASLALSGRLSSSTDKKVPTGDQNPREVDLKEPVSDQSPASSVPNEATRSLGPGQQASGVKTLQDAVKPKNKRKK